MESAITALVLSQDHSLVGVPSYSVVASVSDDDGKRCPECDRLVKEIGLRESGHLSTHLEFIAGVRPRRCPGTGKKPVNG